MSATTVRRPQTVKLRLSNEVVEVGQTNRDGSQFVVVAQEFNDVLGARPHLRRLLRTKEPLFHEAGVYIPQSNTVVMSSNRLTNGDDDQYACVVHLAIDGIPTPAQDAPVHMSELDHAAQSALWPHVTVLRPDASHLLMPNGATSWGADGVLWCEQGKHDLRVEDPEHAIAHSALVAYDPVTRATTALLDSFNGQRFSSLNDVVVHAASGCVFFTDPNYGVEQRFKRAQAYAPNGVYCWQPSTGRVELLDDCYDKPNGCTFVPDPRAPTSSGKGLLVTTDTGRLRFDHERCPYSGKVSAKFVVDHGRPACIYAYPVNYDDDDGCDSAGWPRVATAQRKLVARSSCAGAPDGIHSDDKGNIWAGHADGVHVYSLDWPAATSAATTATPVGRLIGKIKLADGRGVANFCWAGRVDGDQFRLLLFAEDELWEAVVGVNGRD